MAEKQNGKTQRQKTTETRKRTADTIQRILAFLYTARIFAKRINVVGIPVHGAGGAVGFRPSTMVGLPDIIAVSGGVSGTDGKFMGVEVKTGKDRLRPEQEGVHQQIRRVGGVVLVVKDFDDFLDQYQKLTGKI